MSQDNWDIKIDMNGSIALDRVIDAINKQFAKLLGLRPRGYQGNDLTREASIALKMQQADEQRAASLSSRPEPKARVVPHPHEGRSDRVYDGRRW